MKSIFAVVLLLCSTAAFAQKPPAACKLATPAEISAVIGMKVGAGRDNEIVVPQGAFKGQTTTLCTWPVPQAQGTVSISVFRVATPAQRTAALAEMQKTMGNLQSMLKTQGWATELTNVAGLRCLTATPPPALAARKAPAGSSCTADVVRGLTVSIGVNLVGTKLPPAKLKAIYDTVVKHLP